MIHVFKIKYIIELGPYFLARTCNHSSYRCITWMTRKPKLSDGLVLFNGSIKRRCGKYNESNALVREFKTALENMPNKSKVVVHPKRVPRGQHEQRDNASTARGIVQ